MSNLIESLLSAKNIKPLIICGAARSGTRMITDLLNEHKNIAIQEEMHAKTIEKYFDFVDDVQSVFDHYSERKGYRLDQSWIFSKSILTHAFFACANKKEMEGSKKELKYHGIKTPGYERYMPYFEKLFLDSPPVYIYCMRDVANVWRSWKSMGYLDDIAVFTRRYERSLRQAVKIKQQVGTRFLVFDLDAFIVAEKKSEFIEKNILRKMELPVDENYCESVNQTPNRNSIVKRGKNYVADEYLEREVISLKENQKIQAYKETLLKDI
ncbi:sulfotransferase [Halomonas sp. E14]|uniref:sulfotransferase n=1 Tax=Halomonas sp. E14 TaxID=3397245 RepID=UPI00403E823B